MTRLDRYVGRIVVGAFAATLAFFLFLSTLVDLLQGLSGYAAAAQEKGLGSLDLAVELGRYYLQFLPVVFTMVTPFATVIACMMAVARLQHANEIVPMLFVGRSIQVVLRPMLAIAVLAGLAMAASWQWVLPRVGSQLAVAQSFLKDKQGLVLSRLVDESLEGQRFYAREFAPGTGTLSDVCLLVQGSLAADVTLTTAPSATWDPEVGDWRLHGGRLLRTRAESARELLGRPDLTPDYLRSKSRETVDPDVMSYDELADVYASRPHRADVRMAWHRHITYPLANVLLLLLALPLAVHFERGSRIGRVLAAIGLCGAYMLVDLTCQSLGDRNLLHPIVAAWTPTILFGALGVVMFGSTKT